jgi:IS5 family transposase
MLSDVLMPLTDFDRQLFSALVPRDHDLRRALELIPWDDFQTTLAMYYCPDEGRPAAPPVLMLKLEYLRYQFGLSDRQVMKRAETDAAFRCFLQINCREPLPDPSLLSHFRGRLGEAGFRQVFNRVVALAREQGLVKDRLRLKDATHVIANIAVPSTLVLLAQARNKLLAAAEPFDPPRVAGERVNVGLIQERTAGQTDEQRLVARVTHLREIVLWVDALSPPEDAASNRRWQQLVEQRELAHKILADREHPKAGDRTVSTVDPDARCGKHGDWYDGYLLDVLVDADSEIITQIQVLPANGDEAADAAKLVRQEEVCQGNQIEQLSMDGIGFNGRVLRQLEDPEGLALDVYVPPHPETASEVFGPENFVEDSQRRVVTCPAGQTSRYREREERHHATIYRFHWRTCQSCPLQTQCMKDPPKKWGRSVRKNDYEAEYQRARAKAQTPQYAAVRSEHAKVERKLGELMNRHGGRHARYRGRCKVQVQELMACTAMNIKRMICSLLAPAATSAT